MIVLVCNAGSTSLKFKVFDMPEERVLAESRVERVGSRDSAIFHYQSEKTAGKVVLENLDIPTYVEGIRLFLDHLLDGETGVLSDIEQVERVGFKTVLAKGFYGIHELTAEVQAAMDAYMVVAPAHNGPYLEAVRQFQSILPDAMLVGAFETAFHTTIPLERKLYGIPYEWYETYGIQKFGYHGASHSYVADVVAQQAGGSSGRLVSCHLGGSGSLCAIDSGKSVDTSFGFSLQTGVFHSNRVGDVDAYIIPYLLDQGLSMEQILRGLEKEGGMLGISGISGDLRDVEAAALDGNSRADLAINAYCNAILKYIGAYHAELGGLDHLAFTGGIGEKSPIVRGRVCEKLGHLGIGLDVVSNEERHDHIRKISRPDSPVTVWVIPANEELGVARKTYAYSR